MRVCGDVGRAGTESQVASDLQVLCQELFHGRHIMSTRADKVANPFIAVKSQVFNFIAKLFDHCVLFFENMIRIVLRSNLEALIQPVGGLELLLPTLDRQVGLLAFLFGGFSL